MLGQRRLSLRTYCTLMVKGTTLHEGYLFGLIKYCILYQIACRLLKSLHFYAVSKKNLINLQNFRFPRSEYCRFFL